MKPKPYVVSWAKPNCKVLREWTESCKSGTATGIKHMVEYRNSKGNIVQTLKWVVWD